MGLSAKQKQIFAFAGSGYDALICSGAIRTGKSALMTAAFVDWAMKNFSGVRFGICGKTADGCAKNLILPYVYPNFIYDAEDEANESSFALIQGRTLGGVLLDEAALMPRSFVEQAAARCSLPGSRLWFNCNPGSPNAWFYREWILGAEKHRAMVLNFRLEDNPALTPDVIRRYETAYTGVFRRRYILGEWCAAEGLVYDFGERNLTDFDPDSGEVFISVDYGTMNPFSAGLWRVLRGDEIPAGLIPEVSGGRSRSLLAVRVREFYHDGRGTGALLTDEDYCGRIEDLAGGLSVKRVIVDPSAASFIAALRRRGFSVQKARNEVTDGIRLTASALASGQILIHRRCADAIREFGLYRWDGDAGGRDVPVKEDDHAMDEIRYFVNTILRRRI